ncbi:MAG: hypothetical protein RIC19_13500 [Phaeodactylibacter sp.]|uniref:hypothetical protein n=1 Tax=Phaeodactylibacter sp. TaxID=1940289 RepID=UPI0032F021A6
MADKKDVRATVPQLKGAFRAHGKVAEQGEGISEKLLRFYANECGLKALYLKENKLNDTGDLENQIGKKYGHGHDLIRWMDDLKLPNFSFKYKDIPYDPVKQVHEKLRYGVDTSRHNELLKSIY